MQATELNDLRQRILECQKLTAAGEPIPEGMQPSEDELREALLALRSDRSKAASASPAGKSQASAPIDLNELFKKE